MRKMYTKRFEHTKLLTRMISHMIMDTCNHLKLGYKWLQWKQKEKAKTSTARWLN